MLLAYPSLLLWGGLSDLNYDEGVFCISSCFSSILELSVRGESNKFHIFINFILQQIIVSN